MGLEIPYLDLIQHWTNGLSSTQSPLRMLELGDQIIMRSPGVPEITGKEYFTNRGFEHISVDINGRHGALDKDLTKPEQFVQWHNYFHIITNAGTTEHVEPYHDQYTCFGILHSCAKINSIMVHIVPEKDSLEKIGKWRGHCNYYYGQEFFHTLAQHCDYEILSEYTIDQLICVVLKKKTDNDFLIDRTLFLKGIHNVKSHA